MDIEEAIKICKTLLKVKHEIYFTPTDKVAIEKVLQELENSIPKKKIEEKLEELDKSIEKTEKLQPSATRYDTLQRLEYQVEVLQELLEE